MLFHPEWDRPCADCQKYLYDDDGNVQRRPAKVGLPVINVTGDTPCHVCPKIPAGVSTDAPSAELRRHAVEMSERNRKAFRHYLECKAVGQFPDDAIVRRNAAVIRWIEDEFQRRPIERLLAILERAK